MSTAAVIDLDSLVIAHGSHKPPTDAAHCHACAMEAAFLRRAVRLGWTWEQIADGWTDRDSTIDPAIGAFARAWNDRLPDDATRTAIFTPDVLDALLDTRGSPALLLRRAYLSVDWAVRDNLPAWLRARSVE